MYKTIRSGARKNGRDWVWLMECVNFKEKFTIKFLIESSWISDSISRIDAISDRDPFFSRASENFSSIPFKSNLGACLQCLFIIT